MLRRLWKYIWQESRSPSNQGFGDHRLHRSRVRVKRHTGTELNFNHDSPWGWSLKVYDKKRLLGIMQASTPVSCLEVVAPFFAGSRCPSEDFRVLICCNSNHRQLKLDRKTFDHLSGALADPTGASLLEYFGSHFDRDLSKIADSSSITVMCDENNEVIDPNSLFKKVFSS